MKIERYTVKACCGKTSLILKMDCPLDIKIISFLISNGFTELPHFTKIGIVYMTSPELIVTGPIGKNQLQVKCKPKDCANILNEFEILLATME